MTIVLTIACWELFRLFAKWLYWRRKRAKAQAFIDSVILRKDPKTKRQSGR